MPVEHFVVESIDPVEWMIAFLRTHIPDYHLSQITNKRISDNVNVVDAHPLAMEMGALVSAGEAENYQTVLPCIGVELQSVPEDTKFIGGGNKTYQIKQSLVDEIKAESMEQRYIDGDLVPDSTLQALEGCLDALTQANPTNPSPLWADAIDAIFRPSLEVSVWSDDTQITRIVARFVRAILHRARKELKGKGIGLTIDAQYGLYNFDFGRMLVGAQFTMTLISMMKVLAAEVDSTSPSFTSTVKKVELTYPENRLTEPTSTEMGPKFDGIGGQ